MSSIQKNENENTNKEEQYSLYTEQIVKRPWNKVKRVAKHLIKVVGSAVIFGAVAGGVMLLINLLGDRINVDNNSPTKGGVTIPTDGYNWADLESEEESDERASSEYLENDTIGVVDQLLTFEEWNRLMDDRIDYQFGKYKPGIKEFDSVTLHLRMSLSDFKQSNVLIRTSNDGTNYDIVNDRGEFGFVCAESEEYFYILTYTDLITKPYVVGYFYDGSIAPMKYLGSDDVTGLSIYATLKASLSNPDSVAIKTATLGNSYMIQQGAVLMATGKLYGENDMLMYTTASSVTGTLIDVDSNYRLITTDLEREGSNRGVLLNSSGEVVGIITDNANSSDKVMSAIGISELKTLLERLINGKVTPYVGVIPQNVSVAMKNTYDMPEGIYVSDVEQNSPAYRAGVQSGDIIVAIRGNAVSNVRELLQIVYSEDVGKGVVFTVMRPTKDGYREVDITVTIDVR